MHKISRLINIRLNVKIQNRSLNWESLSIHNKETLTRTQQGDFRFIPFRFIREVIHDKARILTESRGPREGTVRLRTVLVAWSPRLGRLRTRKKLKLRGKLGVPGPLAGRLGKINYWNS